jgi:flagellin
MLVGLIQGGITMGTVVNTNTLALTSYRNLSNVSRSQGKASARLSSGKKINSAADDAAGLAISQKMTAQIRGLDMAYKNAQDASAMLQTTEGNASEITNMVQRIRELAVQSANDTNTTSDRAKLQAEVSDLKTEIKEMAGRAEFNALKLSTDKSRDFHIGANTNQNITFQFKALDTTNLLSDMSASFDITTHANAETAIANIDKSLEKMNEYRAQLGAAMNRLEYTSNNLSLSSENLSSARSRIEDADMAKEMMSYTQNNVLSQAATSMLAQGNASTQNVLQLLS